VRNSNLTDSERVSKFMVAQGAPLSRREKQVLDLVLQGFIDKEIGEQLGIECATVRTHVARVCEKLGARTRAQLGRLWPPPRLGKA
jgi:DNA-binding NarL/FixJ family response regulator